MEKFGVEEVPEDKTASRGCPVCGKELIYAGTIRRCPEHGTRPFEMDASDRQGGCANDKLAGNARAAQCSDDES